MKRQISILILIMVMLLSGINFIPFGMDNIGAETWKQTTDTDFDTGILENVEVEGTGEGALIQLTKVTALGTWEQKSIVPHPDGLYGSAMAYDSTNNKIVLFGGFDGVVKRNDTWLYDVSTNTWTKIYTLTAPRAVQKHAMVYDSWYDKVALFGGQMDSGYSNETWLFDTGTYTWTQRTPINFPSKRHSHAMTYDAKNRKVVLFGGYYRNNDTWIYDVGLNVWIQKNPVTHPSGRYGHAMAHDSVKGKTVLFGGYQPFSPLSGAKYDTWIYDSKTNIWTQQSPAKSPLKRSYHAMVYDSYNETVILYGGEVSSAAYNETWSYDLNVDNWTKRLSTPSPGRRYNHAMAYNSIKRRVVLFGGIVSNHCIKDTWVYEATSNNWERKYPINIPYSRYGHAMAFDSANNKVVLFGGFGENYAYCDETWLYDAETDIWTQQNPLTKPSARTSNAMAYDSTNNKIVLFGGYTTGYANDETWLYDVTANTWTQQSPSTKPPARSSHAMAYDSANNKVILLGGYNQHLDPRILNDTWAYDVGTDTWTQQSPSTKPPARFNHAMVYDSVNNNVILFGGYNKSIIGGRCDDTWTYDMVTNTWTQKYPINKPSVREDFAMTFINNKVLLFGGETGFHEYNDETWEYDIELNIWTKQNPSIEPSPRYAHAMVYDSANHKVVLFGGFEKDPLGPSGYNDETWIFNFNSYDNNGTYISKTFVSDHNKWHSISWAADTGPDGIIKFQVAVNNDGTTWDFVGPDGTSSSYYDDLSGGILYSGYSGAFLKYKAFLSTPQGGETPQLFEVAITYITEPPTVLLTSPNGGEDWMRSGWYPITWNAEGDINSTPVCLYYATDNGETWTTIENWTANTGHYNWTVPDTETANALIKVTVTDIYDITVSDTSDASFAIDPPPEKYVPPSEGGDGGGSEVHRDEDELPGKTAPDDSKESKNEGLEPSLVGGLVSVLIIIIVVLIITIFFMVRAKRAKNQANQKINQNIKSKILVKKLKR